MSDIRERCPISCIAHEVEAYACDSNICLKHKAYNQGRADAERDFQNSDEWNDYLVKVIANARADERTKIIDEVIDYMIYEMGLSRNMPTVKFLEQLKEQTDE